jgi:hypothetical protein
MNDINGVTVVGCASAVVLIAAAFLGTAVLAGVWVKIFLDVVAR